MRALVLLIMLVPGTGLCAGSGRTGPTGCTAAAPVAEHGATLANLASTPSGAWVTVYGSGFGASVEVTLGGVPQEVAGYDNNCVVFTAAGPGGPLLVNKMAVGFLPIHPGRVLEARPQTLKGVWAQARPGDVIYLRAGEYTAPFGEGDWCPDCTFETFKRGTAAAPLAIVGYPGEVATFNGLPGSRHAVISLGDQNYRQRRAAFITFADLRIRGQGACIYGGGNTSDSSGGPENTGATDIRVINVVCEITDARSNTMTGMIALQGNRWKILGNTFRDPADRAVIKNNHAIYVQGGADDVEIAYNRLVDLHVGHVIQVHQDGIPFRYDNIRIHDNQLEGRSNRDMRGINVANVDDDSTVLIENNTLRNVGQDFSAIAVYHGTVTVSGNAFYGIRAPDIVVNAEHGGRRRVIASGNRFETVEGYSAIEADNGAKVTEVQLSNNSYCGVRSQETAPRPCR